MDMKLLYSELDNNIRVIRLTGKLDAEGYNSVDLKFNAHCAGDNVRVIVDLSGVTFLDSIGIRMLTMNAQSLGTRNGKMVLLSPIPEVQKILEMTGIPAILPFYSSQESAETILLA